MSDKPRPLSDEVREHFATVDDETFLRGVKGAGFQVVDKPKTLHEQLVELANWFEREREWVERHSDVGYGGVFAAKAAEVHAMAELVKEAEANAPTS